jgi:hypothetical protein
VERFCLSVNVLHVVDVGEGSIQSLPFVAFLTHYRRGPFDAGRCGHRIEILPELIDHLCFRSLTAKIQTYKRHHYKPSLTTAGKAAGCIFFQPAFTKICKSSWPLSPQSTNSLTFNNIFNRFIIGTIRAIDLSTIKTYSNRAGLTPQKQTIPSCSPHYPTKRLEMSFITIRAYFS